MTAALTPARLAEIEALVEKATPGPWEYEYAALGSRPREIASQFKGYTVAHISPRQRVTANPPGGLFPDADARLIVALRNAAPALLAMARECLELRARVAELERRNEGMSRVAEAAKAWRECDSSDLRRFVSLANSLCDAVDALAKQQKAVDT